MEILNSCQEAIDACLASRTFAVSHLYNDEKPMKMHIHDSYEIYYSISGGRQFLIDNRFYTISPGDLFFINQYESHHLTQIDSEIHERIVLSIHPDYLLALSTPSTDLNSCFSIRPRLTGHKLSLNPEERKRFLYYIHRLSDTSGFGAELQNQAIFTELMVYLNGLFLSDRVTSSAKTADPSHGQVDEILSYINQNICHPLSLQELSDHFFLSSSYLCRIFKSTTGTTINKYITAKRITNAKALLSEGLSVQEVCEQCGFSDYSTFFKSFTRIVGISPKKYAKLSS
ncbi:MAG: AraC family transcriptional regulator [Fusicatenibacter sp.]|nr:AraC family transcriptional regulator [Fusicatenibacter sp.]